ncbi:MAG: serine/threonine-protein kinase [Verrucomicrobiales bacterium]
MSNRYEIREQIGKGGLGAVYKALDTQLQREVAIKRVLTPDQATEEEVEEAASKLMAEAQTLSSLNHPNIITVFDVGQDEKGGFVVMELLAGETLDETVERGVLTQDDFIEVVYQTMEALIAAQANTVIHRDIKPTNIMVIWQASGKFQLKILDFGLAKFSKAPSVQTMDQEESVLGSIFFMAPEQFERGELDARTDLYQMGCVYYNALTGQYPFNGETAPQVMNAHLQHKVVPLDQVRPDVSPSICQWVMWLINRDIDHRPQDAREALKHWPRNPEAPGAEAAAEVLPVEETPEVSTGEVTIVTGASQASAPAALLVTGTAPNAPRRGGRTGRLHTGPQNRGLTTAIGGGRPNVRRTGSGSEGGKTKWIAMGIVAALVLLLVGFQAFQGSKEKERRNRISALASSEEPSGSAADAQIALDFLASKDASALTKEEATTVLARLEGANVDAKVLETMQRTDSGPLRVTLAEILAARGHAAAVPAIMSAFRSAATDDQRIRLLQAAGELGNMDNVETILGALEGEHSLAVRRVFEDTVLEVLRQGDDPRSVVDAILERVSSTGGSGRKSLFRILGVLGGEKVKTRLDSIYESDDTEYQRDAVTAYLNWTDRSIAADLENIIADAEDRNLASAAERAYARLATLPAPQSIEERVEGWQKAFEMVNNPNDVQRLLRDVIGYHHPESLALLREWQKNPSHGAIAKSYADTLQKSIAAVPEIQPGESLKGIRASVLGERKASKNSSLESLTNWRSPDTWFTWTFIPAESGTYSLEVDQATLHENPSEFVVHLAGETLTGESEATESLSDFKTVALPGTVSLEAGETYTLTLAAGSRVQPRIMDVGAVRFVAQ